MLIIQNKLNNNKKPIVVMLYGPSGVSKTETARCITEALEESMFYKQFSMFQNNGFREYLYDDYFNLNLVKCSKDEVIVDLSPYIGDTIISYIKNYSNYCYKKIYCYEVTESTFEDLKNDLNNLDNIEFRQKGVADKEGSMSLISNSERSSANTLIDDENGNITITTLDLDIDEPIMLIKADIESFEQKALIGAKNHILNNHPKLLISVYHNNEDLWKIPKMIYDLHSDYKFYLRYNSSPIYPTKITLIAI